MRDHFYAIIFYRIDTKNIPDNVDQRKAQLVKYEKKLKAKEIMN